MWSFRPVVLAALVLGAGAAPSATIAQPAPAMARVGVLVSSAGAETLPVNTFPSALRDLGYVEGRNVTLEWRYHLIQ